MRLTLDGKPVSLTSEQDPRTALAEWMVEGEPEIDLQASDDAIFTCDVGLPTVWAARYATMKGQRRLVGSFNHGSMASAMARPVGPSFL